MIVKNPYRNLDPLFGIENNEKAPIFVTYAPWEVTVSYRGGTSLGPSAICQASSQLDFFDFLSQKERQNIFYIKNKNAELFDESRELQPLAQGYMGQESGAWKTSHKTQQDINHACSNMVDAIYCQTREVLDNQRVPALVGGDHSVALGSIKACLEHHECLGVLHIDAHADLRKAYQGFNHSHASVMQNSVTFFQPKHMLVSVGVRDFSQEEYSFIKEHKQVHCFFDHTIQSAKMNNQSWKDICHAISDKLPDQIYISLDVDGLSPELCLNTGTPVPGGLGFAQVLFLLEYLVKEREKKLIGFDLCEVAPNHDDGVVKNHWDGNVGARLLFHLGCAAVFSSGE